MTHRHAGCVAARLSPDSRSGCIVSVECDTPFTARSAAFTELMDELTVHALERQPTSVADMLKQPLDGTEEGTVEGTLLVTAVTLGENLRLGQVACYENRDGRIGAYVHHDQKLGVLVSATTEAEPETARRFLKQVAMHVASMRPPVLSKDELGSDLIDNLRARFAGEEALGNKPADLQQRIVEARLTRYFAENTLLEQPFVFDEEVTVAEALRRTLGASSTLDGFFVVEVGGRP